jgi:cell wall assembly regulator SMI1
MNWKRLVVIGIAMAVGVLVIAVIAIPRVVRRVLYPLAPVMPAVVAKPVPEILSEIESLIRQKAPRVLEEMQPGLSDEQIRALETKAGLQLPEEIKALYRWHNGSKSLDPRVDGPIPGHRFVPLEEALGAAAVLTNQVAKATAAQRAAFGFFAGHRKTWISLFEDAAGDGYFFDPQRKLSEGAIFFSFAEDGTYLFFPSLGNLLAGTAKCYQNDVFSWKEGLPSPRLEEDFNQSQKIWDEFGSLSSM